MLIPLVHYHMPLRLLLLYIFPLLISARVPITPLTYALLSNTFKLYPDSGKGGCNRNAPNGVPMLDHTLKSVGGARAIAQTVAQDLPNYPTQVYIRGLLFLFFGISFQMDNQLIQDFDNVDAYNLIANTFGMVNQVFLNPFNNLYNVKPRYRCLEDYATYYTHMLNANGVSDPSEPLIGEYLDVMTEGGATRPPPYNDIWPGLMYVNNALLNPLDRTGGWYLPRPSSPPDGACGAPGSQGRDRSTMVTEANITKSDPDTGLAQAIFGITACAPHFDVPTLLDLGTPVQNGGYQEIVKFSTVADLEDLHELFHLVSDGTIIDQPAIVPPVADPLHTSQWTTNRDWTTWIFSAVLGAYGYFYTLYLGLARPIYARFNADSYAIFAICMYFPELDCLGVFMSNILSKRSVPPGISPRAVEKIRSEGFDVERDLGLVQEPAEAEDVGKEYKEKGRSRFRDVFRPSALFG